jgi:hypothetical protein
MSFDSDGHCGIRADLEIAMSSEAEGRFSMSDHFDLDFDRFDQI